MPLALYFKPSYEKLKDRIHDIAPDLDVALYARDGRIEYQGRQVQPDEIAPDYFWIHGDLFKSDRLLEYFKLMDRFESARWLHTINTGLDQLPYLPLVERGVAVTNNHGQAIAIAEFVFGQLLAHFQHVCDLRRRQQDKVWKQQGFREVYGGHWVIVGFGHIGQEIARRAKAFGVRVTAVRRSQRTEGLADAVIDALALPEVLPKADVVILACNSNQQTRHIVDAGFLAAMQPEAVLVNIARGDLVDEDALRESLEKGVPGCAILDVFEEEPLPEDAWFWHHPRVIVTPHTSNGGSGMPKRSTATFLENLRRISNGEPLLNRVTPQDII